MESIKAVFFKPDPATQVSRMDNSPDSAADALADAKMQPTHSPKYSKARP